MSDTQPANTGMSSPVCRVNLLMNERLGVEIDYSPKCRGVWLDRGELDKIIAKAEAELKTSDPGQTSFLPRAQPNPWSPAIAPSSGPADYGVAPRQYDPHQAQGSHEPYRGGHGGYGGGEHGGGHGGHGRRGGFLGRLFD